MDRDCPSKQACIITNNKGDCKNPCTAFQPCVQNAECKVYDSLPLRTMTCTCIEGFTGKGDELCQKISKLKFVCYWLLAVLFNTKWLRTEYLTLYFFKQLLPLKLAALLMMNALHNKPVLVEVVSTLALTTILAVHQQHALCLITKPFAPVPQEQLEILIKDVKNVS